MRVRILSQRFISSINATLSIDIRHESTVQKPQGRPFQAVNRGRTTIPVDFPQVFPQVWKTLARDQRRMELLRAEQFRERTPTLTHFAPIDTLGSRSLILAVRFHSEGES